MLEDDPEEDDSNTDKPDTKQWDKPMTTDKFATIKPLISEKKQDKVSGLEKKLRRTY